MKNTPASENLQPSVLLFFPTLKTHEEQTFWEGFASALKTRGYRPVRVAFLRSAPDTLNGAEDELIPVWRMIDQQPELSNLGDTDDALLKQFLNVAKHTALVETLIEYAGKTTTYTRGSAELDNQAYRRSALAYVHLLLTLLVKHKPVKVVINNDTHPLHFTARLCADFLGIPAIHSERSPFVNQWFEPEGYYGNSELSQFLSDGSWREAGAHEASGDRTIQKLKAAPAGHRADETTGQPPDSLKGARSRPAIFVALDHALATGWSLANHPLRQIHYPIFDTPEKAVSYFSDLGERLGAEIWMKTHPSELKDAEFISTIRNDPRLTFIEEGFEDALTGCDAVVCFLTKTAITGLALGKQVVTIGSNIAALSGLTYHCRELSEIESQIKAALSSTRSEDQETLAKRFLGFLDQNFFLANDLSNAGARRLLDLHFPDRAQSNKVWTSPDKPAMVDPVPSKFKSRGGSVRLNRYRSLDKWISALRVMPQPGLVAAH